MPIVIYNNIIDNITYINIKSKHILIANTQNQFYNKGHQHKQNDSAYGITLLS